MKRNPRRCASFMRLAAFIVLALCTAAGFWRLERTDDESARIRAELYQTRLQADRNLCEKINKSTAVLLGLIDQSATPADPPAGASPELVEAYRLAAERGRAFRAYAAERLQPEDCTVPPIGSRSLHR